MTKTRRVYDSVRGLAELPWFELLGDERVVLAADDIGPVADAHTHLALSYVRRDNVDLWAEHGATQHYLPLSSRLDMEVYVNRNFSAPALKAMKRDLTLTSMVGRGMRRTHTAANLLREMDELRIAVSLLLPVDFPVLSWNAETYLAVADGSTRFASLGSVHPYASKPAERLARQKALGARGVKVHPAVQTVAPDNPRAMALYRHCAELGLPVLWHCGPVGIEPLLGRHLCQLKHYWRAIRENPDTFFVLGHAGALQMEMALELAQRYPNVALETSSQSLGNVRRIIAEAPPERVVFGSDWPFYHQSIALAKVLIATDGDPAARRRVLWENAARIFCLERP